MDNDIREKIMSYKEGQLKRFELALLMTGIAGVLVLAFYAYIMFISGQLATSDGKLRESLYGLDVIVFAAAIGCAYSFINFNNLRNDDKNLNRDYFVEFRAKTERYVATSQGIMVCDVFTLLYWLIYTNVMKISQYVDKSGELHSFTTMNYIFLALMLIAALFSFNAVRHSFNMKHKLGLSKEDYTVKKVRS